MKKLILSLFAAMLGVAAFSQQETPKGFELIATDSAVVSYDSIVTFTGNVEVRGDAFHFRKAGKIVYNKKENILLVYNCAEIHADSLTVITGADGKKYIRYRLK
jgi:lipopolysaccharide assembly outer membrane protein LptD (OstA)